MIDSLLRVGSNSEADIEEVNFAKVSFFKCQVYLRNKVPALCRHCWSKCRYFCGFAPTCFILCPTYQMKQVIKQEILP